MNHFIRILPLLLSFLFLLPFTSSAQNGVTVNDDGKHWFGGVTISNGYFRDQQLDGNEMIGSQSNIFYYSGEVFGTYISDKDVYYTFGLGYGWGRNTSSGTSDYSYGQNNIDYREFERERLSEDYLVNVGMGKQYAVNRFRFLPGANIGYHYNNQVMRRDEVRFYDDDQLVLRRTDKRHDMPSHELDIQLGGQVYYALSDRFHLGLEVMVTAIDVSYAKGKSSRTITTYDHIANTEETESIEGLQEETINVGLPFYEEFGVTLRYRIK